MGFSSYPGAFLSLSPGALFWRLQESHSLPPIWAEWLAMLTPEFVLEGCLSFPLRRLGTEDHSGKVMLKKMSRGTCALLGLLEGTHEGGMRREGEDSKASNLN